MSSAGFLRWIRAWKTAFESALTKFGPLPLQTKPCVFFAPRTPNGFGFPASAACSTKLEYLILNHRRRHMISAANIDLLSPRGVCHGAIKSCVVAKFLRHLQFQPLGWIAVLAASLGMTKGLLKPLVVSNYMSSGATKLFRQVSRPKRPAPSF